jgi:hypothetical protein
VPLLRNQWHTSQTWASASSSNAFPWLDDEAKPIVCKKWAAEAQWVKHGDEYRMREHAIGDTPEEVVGKLETLIAEQSMRHNVKVSDGGGL